MIKAHNILNPYIVEVTNSIIKVIPYDMYLYLQAIV